MAEERTRDKDDLERLRKQEQQMRNIIKSMQAQGRGPTNQQELVDDEGTESEYDEEYEDEEDEDEDEEDDDDGGSYDGEEELAAEIVKPVFGPVPPPEMLSKQNGQKATIANGVKH
jgi:hypothetical protein